MKKIMIGSLMALMAMGCGGLQKEKSKKMVEKSTAGHLVVGDTLTTASGLKILLKVKGTGVKVDSGDKVTIHYNGYFPDGKPFDSSVKRGQPFQTKIGVGQVIKGWDEGVTMLHVGDTAQMIIPPHLGYGSTTRGPIPGNSTLVFDVMVIDTKKPVIVAPYDVKGKDTLTTASGLKYIVVSEGKGPKAVVGANVSVHYSGYLLDGKKFDSSVERGDPFVFPLGQGRVIAGWDEGVALMKEGDKMRFIIPYNLGYGEQGYPPVIPEKATLIFDVELIKAQ